MAAPTSSVDSRRSWRQPPSGALAQRSRYVWRWLLSGVLLLLLVAAAIWAWPRPVPRTLLLVLYGDRQERVLPVVPFVDGDREALIAWAEAAKVPHHQLRLTELGAPTQFVRQLTEPNIEGRYKFTLKTWKWQDAPANKNDLVVVYVKGHGLAAEAGAAGSHQAAAPLIIKSLGEESFTESRWWENAANTLNVEEFLRALAAERELKKLVIFDSVHMSYDPRLGMLTNAFPQAVKAAAAGLKADHLWVVVGQSGGQELSRGLPASERSVLVESLVTLLSQSDPQDSRTIELAQLVEDLDARLRGMQSPQLVYPAAGDTARPAARIVLTKKPYEKPSADGKPPGDTKTPPSGSTPQNAPQTPSHAEPAKTAFVPASPQSLLSGAASGSLAWQQAAPAAAPANASPSTAGDAKGNVKTSPPAADAPQPAKAPPPANSPSPPAGVASPPTTPPPPESDLELAWKAHDALSESAGRSWSPLHVAPIRWRHLEGLLTSFDERELCRTPLDLADQATLRSLRQGLESLRAAAADGSSATTSIGNEDCEAIERAYRGFLQSDAQRSFQSRRPGDLDAANDAVKTLAEATYRAADYIRLHGRLASAVNVDELTRLLASLKALRGLLSPKSVADGRLTPAHSGDLQRLAAVAKNHLRHLQQSLALDAERIAAAASSPDKMHCARLLLESPLLAADIRRSLRPISGGKSTSQAGAPLPPSTIDLARNMELWRAIHEVVFAAPATAASSGGPAGSNAGASLDSLPGRAVLMTALRSPPPADEPLRWTALGTLFRQAGEELARAVRGAGAVRPNATATLDLYLASLLVDGRDVQQAATGGVWIAQPLRAAPVADRIVLSAPESLSLGGPSADPTLLELQLTIESDKPPPHRLTLSLRSDAAELLLRSAETKAPLGSEPIRLESFSDKKTVGILVSARRDSASGPATATIGVSASFADSPPVSQQVVCRLPRPDEVDLLLAADDVPGASSDTWLPRGAGSQQGGRLLLFPNRHNTFSFFVKNLSSDEKRLRARLYAVPRDAFDKAGRLFQPRSPAKLLSAIEPLDGQASLTRDWQDRLIAQSGDKEPFMLPRDQASWLRIPLAPVAAGAAAPAPVGANAASPPPAIDVTSGLLLVLLGDSPNDRPYFKWIELQTHRPSALVEIERPTFTDGKLSFAIALKEDKFMREMGLTRQPLKVFWNKQPLPPQLAPAAVEKELTGASSRRVEFSATSSGRFEWPLFLQLDVDGYPRGLVAELDRSLNLVNYKLSRPPSVHITRLTTSTEKSGEPPSHQSFTFDPPEPWLPYPTASAGTEPGRRWPLREPVLVRVDDKATAVRLSIDLGADGVREIDEGVRLSVDGQPQDFPRDRRLTARLAGVEGGALKLVSEVTDLTGVAFGPIGVERDRRLAVVAEVLDQRDQLSATDRGYEKLTVVLDRTAPLVGPITATKLDAILPPGAASPVSRVLLQCPATDGEGAGVADVQFISGIDMNNNGRLEENERRPPLAARPNVGVYIAELDLPMAETATFALVEAVATDRVGHRGTSQAVAIALPRKATGGNRSTFGGKKSEEEAKGKQE
jgi:hypothetical protein